MDKKEPFNQFPGVCIMRTCDFCKKTFLTDYRVPYANCCLNCDAVFKLKAEVDADKKKMEQIELIRMALQG
jgi:hypothetical protein